MNKKAVLTLVMMAGGVAAMAVAIHVQTDPLAFTRRPVVTNVTLPVVPEEPRAVTVDEVVITGEAEEIPMVKLENLPKVTAGAAMKKQPAKKPCKLTYRVIGFTDDTFETFRGVFSCDPQQ